MEATISIEREGTLSLQIYNHNSNGGRMSSGTESGGSASPITIFEPRSYIETKNNSMCSSFYSAIVPSNSNCIKKKRERVRTDSNFDFFMKK